MASTRSRDGEMFGKLGKLIFEQNFCGKLLFAKKKKKFEVKLSILKVNWIEKFETI